MNNKKEFLARSCRRFVIVERFTSTTYSTYIFPLQHTVNLLSSRADDIFFCTEFHQLLSHGFPIRVSGEQVKIGYSTAPTSSKC